MEVTKREILVGIAIFFIMMSIGIIIKCNIENSINSKNEKYYKALKIDKDENMFVYALKTNVGYILAQGNVVAIDPIEKDIEGQYLYLEKNTEVYTKHTREVKHTIEVGNTTETYYTIEEYWTWDRVDREEYHSEKFKYLGIEFNYEDIKFHNSSYQKTIDVDYYTRYVYYGIPSEFQGCLFSKIEDNQCKDIEFKCNTTIEDVIESKKKEAGISSTVFIVVWIFLSIGVAVGYVFLDNNYLED